MGSLAVKQALQKGAGIKLGIAFASGILGVALTRLGGQSPIVVLALPLLLAAVVAWYWGLGQYCMSKGYSGILAVAGLLGLIGLIILLVLPDRFQVAAPPVISETNYPRPVGNVTTIV